MGKKKERNVYIKRKEEDDEEEKGEVGHCWREPTSDDEIYEKYTRRIKKTPDAIRPLTSSSSFLLHSSSSSSSRFSFLLLLVPRVVRTIHHDRFTIMTAHLFEFYDDELI